MDAGRSQRNAPGESIVSKVEVDPITRGPDGAREHPIERIRAVNNAGPDSADPREKIPILGFTEY